VKAPDAGVDADLIDADLTATANVVTELVPGTPAPMIDVVSLRPNQSVADHVQTDATGHASVHVYPGGSVTAIFPHTSTSDMGADLATVSDVQPNDTLTFTPPNAYGGGVNMFVGQMSATWPALVGTSYYYLVTPCGEWYAGGGTGYTFTEYSSCHRDPMSIAYIAFNPQGQIIGYAYQTGVTFTNGGSTSISSWIAAKNLTLSVPVLPNDLQIVYTYPIEVLNGTRGYQAFAEDTNPMMPFSSSFTMPGGDRLVGYAVFVRHGNSTSQSVYDALPGSTWNLAAPTELPWVTGEAFGLPDHKLVWFADGNQPYDGIGAIVGWVRQVTGPPAMTNTYTWTFAIKPGETEYTFPQLPAPFDALMPTLDDQPSLENLRLIDFPGVADWNAFRALPSQQFACAECQVYNGTYMHVQTSP
jgi:hypothetical protein